MPDPITSISVDFEYSWLKQKLPFSSREIRLILLAMQAELSRTNQCVTAQIECFFVGDAKMEDLNQSYLNSPGPTNTLAFEATHIDSQAIDTVACPAQIFFSTTQYERERILYGQHHRDYAIFLLAHAMAHLTGLTHGPEMDVISEKLQDVALKRIQA